MITLFAFGARFGVQDLSPFVLKVDAYMRMTGIPFQVKSGFHNLKTAPKGKLPYIQDDEQLIADSTLIIQHLKQHHNANLDADLSEAEQATANLVIRALDDSFYWCLVYARWLREGSWQIVKPAFFKKMPFPLRYIAPYVARRRIRQACHNQGISRHSDAEILAMARQVLQDLSVLLGNKDYFFGDKPSTLDATVFGFLAQIIISELKTAVTPIAQEFPNLVSFCQRVQEQYYSE
ncbi:MAG: glutathione S-transferase [Oceanospirillum sp.]|nr:glutathione S-transferase [Oceanospirillum sp.]